MYALHLSFIMHKIHLQGSKKPKTETISWWPWVLSGVTFAFPCCIPHHYNSSCYQNAPPNDHQWSCSPLHINYIPDLHSAICNYLDHCMSGMSHDIIGWRCTLPDSSLPSDRIQIWTKVLIQISNYISWPLACRSCSNYNSSPSQECSHGLYTSAIFSPTSASDWPFQVLNATYILYAIDQLIFKHWLTVFQATLSLNFDLCLVLINSSSSYGTFTSPTLLQDKWWMLAQPDYIFWSMQQGIIENMWEKFFHYHTFDLLFTLFHIWDHSKSGFPTRPAMNFQLSFGSTITGIKNLLLPSFALVVPLEM